MNKKVVIIASSAAAVVLAAGITAAVLLTRPAKNPSNGQLPVSSITSDIVSPSVSDEASTISNSDSQSTVSEVLIPDTVDADSWDRLKPVIESIYYTEFSSVSDLSDEKLFGALEGIVNTQDALGNRFLVQTTQNSDGNLIPKEEGDRLLGELFGKTLSSPEKYLTPDKSAYLFPFAGGVGNPEITSKNITSSGDGQFKIFCTLKRVNAGGEVTYSGGLTVTVKYTGGEYLGWTIVSMNKTSG